MPLHYLRFPGMQTLHVASCSRRAYPPARRRHQIPIAPVAPPVPNFPRLRALALFGRRPVERAGLSLLPASKNLHNKGSHSLVEAFKLSLSALEIGCVEPFRKPVINWHEKISRFSALTLISPVPGKTHGSAQLKQARALQVGQF